MPTSKIVYKGELRTSCIHIQSGTVSVAITAVEGIKRTLFN